MFNNFSFSENSVVHPIIITIIIIDFLRQEWLYERTSILGYAYIFCFV
jgi:hypothetical protein